MTKIHDLDFWYLVTHSIFVVLALGYCIFVYRTGILYLMKNAISNTQTVINGVKNDSIYDEVNVAQAKGNLTSIFVETFFIFCFCVLLPAFIFDFTTTNVVSLITTATILIIFAMVLLVQCFMLITWLTLWALKRLSDKNAK